MTAPTWGDAPPNGRRVPGSLPPLRPDQLAALSQSRAGYGPAPASPIIVARRVIITGPDDGLFVYSPSPGLGNLTNSIAAMAGTDFYGNAYLQGTVSYFELGIGNWFAVALNQGQVQFWFAANPTGPWADITGLQAFNTGNVDRGVAVNGNLRIGSITDPPLTYLAPTGDTSGIKDSSIITSYISNGLSVFLMPGQWFTNSQLVMNGSNVTVMGAGPATVITPTAGMASIFRVNSSRSAILDLLAYGGTGLSGGGRSSNPAADVISIAAGAQWVWLRDVQADYNNGWIINPDAITNASHWSISGIRGFHNAGGINMSSATPRTVQITFNDIDIQQSEVNPCLALSSLQDVAINQLNAASFASAGVSTVSLLGCSTLIWTGVDIGFDGAGSTSPTLLLDKDAGGNQSTDCHFIGGTVQAGGIGVSVAPSEAASPGSTAVSRCTWHGIQSKNNNGDAWRFDGNGTGMSLDACTGNGTPNGSFDVNVSGQMHLMLDKFTFASSLPAFAYNLAIAGNHVTVNNPTFPGGLAGGGFPAGGW